MWTLAVKGAIKLKKESYQFRLPGGTSLAADGYGQAKQNAAWWVAEAKPWV